MKVTTAINLITNPLIRHKVLQSLTLQDTSEVSTTLIDPGSQEVILPLLHYHTVFSFSYVYVATYFDEGNVLENASSLLKIKTQEKYHLCSVSFISYIYICILIIQLPYLYNTVLHIILHYIVLHRNRLNTYTLIFLFTSLYYIISYT